MQKKWKKEGGNLIRQFKRKDPIERENFGFPIIIIIIILLVLVSSAALFAYFHTSEKTLNLGANIQEIFLSEDWKTAYIKLAGGSNEQNISSIKFIFTDVNKNEYAYETTEGAQEISVPFKRSFWFR